MSCVMALDQGTTSSRAVVVDEDGRLLGQAQREFGQIFPRPGWVEHDPIEIWRSQSEAADEALRLSGVARGTLAGLGITNQRETTVLWERRTGRPVHNAIVWQDRRTAGMIDELKARGAEPLIRRRTGLVPDAYFSATKIRWLLDHVPGARAAAEAGELAFGTIDCWLVHRLSEGRLHVTDATNASRTMLFDIHRGEWDDELLDLFEIPRSILPRVVPSSGACGEASAPACLRGVPIAGIAGDQQAALVGQLCRRPGDVKCTYGTGCFALMNTGASVIESRCNLLSTVASRLDGALEYALEGSVFIGGAVVQWLRDGLGLIRSSGDIVQLASSVPDSGDVYLVPAFAGLGAPHWDQYARGTICGITRGTTAGHIARAAVESIAYQVADLVDAMRRDAGLEIPELRVDGGAARNDALMQFQADISRVAVVRPRMTETTALGAAFLAGVAAGVWPDLEALARIWRVERRFEPRMLHERAAALRERWSEAVRRSRGWAAP